MFKGSMVAVITPMHTDGSIDYKSLANLIEWHIASKTDGIIVSGTTGEAATLDHDEQADLIAFVVKQVAGRIPVIAGTGTNATRSTIALSKQAKTLGVDGCLIVTPYYNKPTQKGLYEHFKTVAEEVDLPIILYNVPARTGCDLLPSTVAELAKIKNIVGIKEATGKIERAEEIIASCDSSFIVLSGDDLTAFSLMCKGAKGVISVTANVTPLEMYEMCEAALNNQLEIAEAKNQKLIPLHTQLFIESNPIPTKWALHLMGKIQTGIRLPLLPLDPKYHQEIKKALKTVGVL